jgi:hypothetical protein
MKDKIATENVEMCVVRTDTKKLEFRSNEYIEAILSQLA